MTLEQTLNNTISADTEGLDHVFAKHESAPCEQNETHGQTAVEALSIEEAEKILGLNQKSILKLIRQGKLCATRENSSWSICLDSINEYCQQSGQATTEQIVDSDQSNDGSDDFIEITLDAVDHKHATTAVTIAGTLDLKILLDQLKAANERLQAANFRIGYLECQLEVQEKLLTDSKPKQSFWKKLVSKFSA